MFLAILMHIMALLMYWLARDGLLHLCMEDDIHMLDFPSQQELCPSRKHTANWISTIIDRKNIMDMNFIRYHQISVYCTLLGAELVATWTTFILRVGSQAIRKRFFGTAHRFVFFLNRFSRKKWNSNVVRICLSWFFLTFRNFSSWFNLGFKFFTFIGFLRSCLRSCVPCFINSFL